MRLDDTRLLAFAEKLQSANDVSTLCSVAAAEVREVVGYQTAWIAVFDFGEDTVRILAAESDNDVDIWAKAPVFPIAADPYMVRIASSSTPQVVRDARTDPHVNRAIVEALGNRTIVNVPMWLMDQPFGALGSGSFGDEGVVVPTDEQLDYLQAMANQLVVASARIVLTRQRQDAAAEKARVEQLLEQRDRLASLGKLAGGVAHDFNNLLTVIMASTEFLRERHGAPEQQDELDIIFEAVDRAAELTRHLLTLGKRQSLALGDVRPNELVTSAVDMIRRVIPADIEIRLTTAPRLPRLAADRMQLEQVITNLCLNARDAMPDGGTLTISSDIVELTAEAVGDEPGVKPGTYLEIRVSDTGSGVPPDVLPRIFEPFFTTKTPDKGTGLGLAVCRGVVEQHGGVIRADSAPGAGAAFSVFIPVRQPIAVPAPTADTDAYKKGNERVLVADDQPYVLRAVERALTMYGYDVVSVGDGEAAIEAVKDSAFDLVILDAIMPRLGGRAAYDQIRTLRPETRFLFASGYGAEEMTARFLADTNVELLSKPFAPDTLLRAVRRVLDATDNPAS